MRYAAEPSLKYSIGTWYSGYVKLLINQLEQNSFTCMLYFRQNKRFFLMLHVVLHNPKIPPNTGNVIRLMANSGFQLHLIEPLGFDFEEKQLRRAGLDYHDLARVERHADFAAFQTLHANARMFAITTKGQARYSDVAFQPGDVLVFGSETEGLPDAVMQTFPAAQRLRIPMLVNNRSLNLSNSVAIVVYEAWRQLDFSQGS